MWFGNFHIPFSLRKSLETGFFTGVILPTSSLIYRGKKEDLHAPSHLLFPEPSCIIVRHCLFSELLIHLFIHSTNKGLLSQNRKPCSHHGGQEFNPKVRKLLPIDPSRKSQEPFSIYFRRQWQQAQEQMKLSFLVRVCWLGSDRGDRLSQTLRYRYETCGSGGSGAGPKSQSWPETNLRLKS